VEKYQGTKFKTILEIEEIDFSTEIKKLIFWGKTLSKHNFIPHYKNEKEPERKSSGGNLSFRFQSGFVITASYSDIENLRIQDFVFVQDADLQKKIVYATGLRNPSSESMMHHAIYKARNDVNAIFHGHFNKLLQNYAQIGLVSTKKFADYGTIELVNSILEVLEQNDFLILKKHGFISLGKDIDKSGKLILEINRELKKVKQNMFLDRK